MSTAPAELQHKFRVIFDGIDTEFFQRRPQPRPTEFRGVRIGPETKVVTYVSRGLESIRGFDIFMKVAKRIYQEIPEVIFLVAGEERTNYGHELHHIGPRSFKDYVLAQNDYDLEQFHFLGRIPADELATLYSLSDVHVYLTVPYALSWSLMQAMAAECRIVGSATAPVQEVIDPGIHGLLADFYDVDGLAENALRVLRDPQGFTHLGTAARTRIRERYEKKQCIAQLVEFFEDVRAGFRPGSASATAEARFRG
jgi:glycosyltransferase involved in cell wall biosynthesis